MRFLDMSFGSLRELDYQTSLATRLGYFRGVAGNTLSDKCTDASKVLAALIRSLRST
jgi:four helix bundle protein